MLDRPTNNRWLLEPKFFSEITGAVLKHGVKTIYENVGGFQEKGCHCDQICGDHSVGGLRMLDGDFS